MAKKTLSKFRSMHKLHWIIVLLSLILTFIAWYITQQQVDTRRLNLFNRESLQVIELVEERMTQYVETLWSGVALIKSNNDHITYAQWKEYVDNLNLIQKYPGINGMGIIFRVYPNQLDTFLNEQRKTRPDFHIHPSHSNSPYMPITYIIPVRGNERAVGLDMAHEKNRFTAAIKSMRTGTTQITGPIILVQDQEKTPGFLLYVPFYKGGTYSTTAERDAHFIGLVYAPFIVKKLMHGVLDKANRHITIKLTDGDKVLYNEQTNQYKNYNPQSAFHFKKDINIYGQTWTFHTSAGNTFTNLIKDTQPLTILIGGIIIDGLLLLLFITLSRSNKRALDYADSATEKLKQKTAKLEESNTQLNKTKIELEKMAHIDSLTQLPNRYSFTKHLEKILIENNKNNKIIAVCFLDLDNFKVVNDSIGHAAGDKLLQAIPVVLKKLLRERDYLAHLSGDEFGLIIEQVESINALTNIIYRCIETLNRPIKFDTYELKITASIGIALYPTAGKTTEELIKHADIAMYKAKESGKNTFHFFNEKTNQQVKRHHEIGIALETAVLNDEFHLLYQPQVHSDSKKLFGVEALIRWQSEELGNVGPDEFIPIAEESYTIHTIGNWVLHQAGKDYQALRSLLPDVELSVNISIRQLEQEDFGKTISMILSQYNIDTRNLTLEVTETAAMNRPQSIIQIMQQLKKFNIRFALDDFGMGYSSIGYLKAMPISYIKIDKSFVRDIESDASDAAIVKAVISLSQAINVKTIAEGVETEAQSRFLLQAGCDYQQGYYFDKPMTLSDLIKKYK